MCIVFDIVVDWDGDAYVDTHKDEDGDWDGYRDWICGWIAYGDGGVLLCNVCVLCPMSNEGGYVDEHGDADAYRVVDVDWDGYRDLICRWKCRCRCIVVCYVCVYSCELCSMANEDGDVDRHGDAYVDAYRDGDGDWDGYRDGDVDGDGVEDGDWGVLLCVMCVCIVGYCVLCLTKMEI